MEKRFYFTEPTDQQYSQLYIDELRRLVEDLDVRGKKESENSHSKEDLIQVCKAYYTFIRMLPKKKEANKQESCIILTEFKDDDLVLNVPVFKKNKMEKHKLNASKNPEPPVPREDDPRIF